MIGLWHRSGAYQRIIAKYIVRISEQLEIPPQWIVSEFHRRHDVIRKCNDIWATGELADNAALE